MSRRRGGGAGGGGVTAQSLGGAQWRQREELAALAAALQLLPTAAAPPVRLLRDVQRVLLCVEHTLYGVQLSDADDVEYCGDGDAYDNGVWGCKRHVGAAAAAGAATLEVSEPGRDPAGRERVAADRAAVQLREVVQSLVCEAGGPSRAGSGNSGGGGGRSVEAAGSGCIGRGGGGGGDCGWDGGLYSVALLHHLLALSSDLLFVGDVAAADAVGGGGSGGGGDHRSSGWVLYRDPLAAASRRRLPLGVYFRVIVAMGWEDLLLDLLAWVPEPTVAAAIVRQALRRRPDLAPGLAAALVAATGGADVVVRQGADAAAAAAVAKRCRPVAAAWLLTRSTPVLAGLAEAVRQADAAGPEVRDGPACGGGAATSGRVCRWLPCLLLLGRALAEALRGWGGHAAAWGGSGGASLAEACCEALQDGLCTWQEGVVAAAAAAAAAAATAAGEGGAQVQDEAAAAAANDAAALLHLAQQDLLGLLDEQAREHLAAQHAPAESRQQQQQQQQHKRPPAPLLPYTSVIRLRSRLVLVTMQVGTAVTAAAAAAASTQPPAAAEAAVAASICGSQTSVADAVASTVPGIGAPSTASERPPPPQQQLITEDDVWRGLTPAAPSTASAATPPATTPAAPPPPAAAAAPPRGGGGPGGGTAASASAERLIPAWLRAATVDGAAAAATAAAATTGPSFTTTAPPAWQLPESLTRSLLWPSRPPVHRPATIPSFEPSLVVPVPEAAVAGRCGFGAGVQDLGVTARLRAGDRPRERAVAVATALLTPGMASWLAVQRDGRVAAAAGADPYSPFRVALALLEMLQGALRGGGELPLPAAMTSAAVVPAAAGLPATAERATEAGGGGGGREGEGGPGAPRRTEDEAVGAAAAADKVSERQLELLVLCLAAECLGCVSAAGQQAALQAVVTEGPPFASLSARLAADAALHAAAGRALVALSNRTAALEGSLDHLALSAAQEVQRLAAAARDLLPYTVLTPTACVRRLVLDGLAHPGQQPWVLQLLRCFAVAAAAPSQGAVPYSGTGGGAAATAATSVLMACLRGVLEAAERRLRTGADRRSLVGLMDGLVRCGVVAPRGLLRELVTPALEAAAAAEARRVGGRSVVQALSALLVARHILGGGGGGGGGGGAVQLSPALPLPYSPATELAAARPARLLLAVARLLGDLYDKYDKGRQLEAPAIDAAASVLECCVGLYGGYLYDTQRRTEGSYGRAEAEELRELAGGCLDLPRRLLAVLVPLLELPAAAGARPAGGDGGGGGGDGGGEYDNGDGDDDGDGGGRSRALAARLAPAALWRPRRLHAADARAAGAVVYDTLTFAASSAAHAAAVRQVLLATAAAAGADEAAGDGNMEEDEVEGRGGDGNESEERLGDAWMWAAWGTDPPGGVTTSSPTIATAAGEGPGAGAGLAGGAVARHVAATAARGLTQLPTPSLLEALVSSLAALLPTASPEQARRVLLAALPALVRTAYGGAAAAVVQWLRSGGVAARFRRNAGGGRVPAAAPDGGTVSGAGAGDPVIDVVVWGMEALASARSAAKGAGPAAADVAAAVVLVGRAAAAALRQAAAGGTSPADADSPHAGGAVDGGDAGGAGDGGMDGNVAAAESVRQQRRALVAAVSDRCAAHFALIATRLCTAAAAPASRPLPSAHGSDPRLPGASAVYDSGTADGHARTVTAVALVLLAELCGVAAEAAAAAAVAEGDKGSQQSRALDVWQAVILSVLQQLVSALAAESYDTAPDRWTPSYGPSTTVQPTPSPPPHPSPTAAAAAVSTAAVCASGEAWARSVLRRVRYVLRMLPGPAALVLWGAVERLCEEAASHGCGGAGAGMHGGSLAAAARDVDGE